jgi:hypothetical protein
MNISQNGLSTVDPLLIVTRMIIEMALDIFELFLYLQCGVPHLKDRSISCTLVLE